MVRFTPGIRRVRVHVIGLSLAVVSGASCQSEGQRLLAAIEQTPAQLAVVTQPGGAIPGGLLNTQPVIQIQDAKGNPVAAATALVSASLLSGSGTLAGTTQVNAKNGVATFSDLRIDVAGSYTIGFDSPGLPQVQSSSVIVTTPPPAALGIQRQPVGTLSGVPLSVQPVVRVLDAAGNVIGNASLPVTASLASGTGSLSGATTVDAVDGIATFNNLTITGSGTHSLQFGAPTVAPVTSLPLSLSSPTPPAAILAIATQPAGAVSDATFATQPVIQVRDAQNNLSMTSAAVITAAIGSGGGTLTGTATATATNGVAQFSDLGIRGSGPHTLTFSSPGLAGTTTASLMVSTQSGTPTQLAMSVQPIGGSSGAPLSQQPVVQVRDANGAIAPNSTSPVTASIFSGGGILTGTTTVQPVNGIAAFDLTISGSGPQILRFTSVGLSAVNSIAFTIAGAATQLAITTQPVGAVSGNSFSTQPVVQLRDVNNAVATTSTAVVTATITSGGGSLIGTTIVPTVNGVAIFSDIGITGTGSHSITFSAPGLASIVSSSILVQSAPGTPTQLAVSTQPAGATSGVRFTTQPVVQIRDVNDVVVSSAGGNVTAVLSSGSGSLTGTTTIGAINGIATFTDLAITGSGSHSLSFSSTGLPSTASSAFPVFGAATTLALTTQPSASTMSGDVLTRQPVVQLRDASNNAVAQAGILIRATLASGTGTLSGMDTARTAANGSATFSDLELAGSGVHTIAFSSTGLTSATSSSINVLATVTPLMTLSFDGYASTAALIGDCVTWQCVEDNLGPAGIGVVLDDTVAPPGASKSMRYHYNHPNNGCNSITRGRAFAFPSAQQEVWAEFRIRWSSNFSTSNASCAPNDHKLIFGDTEAGLSGRWAFYVGADSPPAHSLQVERPSATGGTGGYYMNMNSPSIIAEQLWNGAWHTVRLHIKHSTTATSGDGMLEVWINGVLKHRESNFNTAKPTSEGGGPDRLSGFSFAHNKDDGPANVDMYIWWGLITVYSVNPGW